MSYRRRKKNKQVSSATTGTRVSGTPVEDKSIFYTDLSAVDPSQKFELWAAQTLFYMKRSSQTVRFLDPVRAALYRGVDRLELNEATYKKMIDPPTPMGAGGTAEYFSSDWKANPIYLHLKNIVKAEIDKSSKQLEVGCTDKFAKTRRMNDNYRILYKEAFRNLINEIAPQLGLPGISDSQDPFKWAQNISLKEKSGDDQRKEQSDIIGSITDLIKNQITDSQDLALYNEYIYKCDYELAFELGIEHYLMNQNKWRERWSDEFLDDVMHFNKACGEWYTDLLTGRPVVERFVPEALNVSRFRRKDGSDIMYYFIEYPITFGDFTRQIGRNLSPQQLKEVFELNKAQGASHGIGWDDQLFDLTRSNLTRDNAMIQVGKAAFLSQDLSVLIEDTSSGFPTYQPADISWYPMQDETHKNRIEKNYNVWRWWYYIPPTTQPGQNADYVWQSQYIFELQKNQDQFRFGEEGRYSKSPLVIIDNSSQASFTDVTQSFMPKIHNLWHQAQNYQVNGFDATIFSDDFIGGILGAIDEDNKINAGDPNQPTGGNGRDAFMQQWKMIKQSKKGFLKMTDSKGNPIIDPSKMVLQIDDKHLEKAEQCLLLIFQYYDMMIKSLAFSPMTAGEEIKPRTPVAALEQSLKASDSSKFFIQKTYEDFLKMYGEMIVRYILLIAGKNNEGFPKRWEEFMDSVGYANGLAVEGLADVPPESVGLTVTYVDNTAKKEFIMELALSYVKTNQLGQEFLDLILATDNWKYGLVLMRMGLKKKQKEQQELAAQQQQYIMEQKDADLKIAMALQGAKDSGKNQNIATQALADEHVDKSLNLEKFKTQSALKSQTGQQKMAEEAQKKALEKELIAEEIRLKQLAGDAAK